MEVTAITVHTAATYPSMDVGSEFIRKVHVEENKWSDIGYHKIIRRDGTIEQGRSMNRQGAHVGKFNKFNGGLNMGIVLMGGLKEGTNEPEDNYTEAQFNTLFKMILKQLFKTPNIPLRGHNEWEGYEERACPCFDFDLLRRTIQHTANILHENAIPTIRISNSDIEDLSLEVLEDSPRAYRVNFEESYVGKYTSMVIRDDEIPERIIAYDDLNEADGEENEVEEERTKPPSDIGSSDSDSGSVPSHGPVKKNLLQKLFGWLF